MESLHNKTRQHLEKEKNCKCKNLADILKNN